MYKHAFDLHGGHATINVNTPIEVRELYVTIEYPLLRENYDVPQVSPMPPIMGKGRKFKRNICFL